MRSSGNSSVPPVPIPEPKPNPHRDLARELVQEPSAEAEARMAAAVAEVHEIIAALHSLAARVERLRASGRQHQRAPSLDIPQDIPKWRPGNSLNMPGNLGGEYFETSGEAHFWGELDLQDVREDVAESAATLTRYLKDADPYNAIGRAEELLARLPAAMLDALRARLAKLARARK